MAGKPVFEDLFAFSGRRNRMSYFLYIVVYFFLLIGAIALGGAFAADWAAVMTATEAGQAVPASAISPIPLVALGLFIIVMTISSWAVASQRCRDMGVTGWLVLVQLIPYINLIFALVLLFWPGTDGDNAFGEDPRG